jgi:hypothetical protein
MRYLKEVLVDATKLPAAVEEKLPAGAPKISKMLTDAANKLPTGPGSPIEIPELPTPKFPELPGGGQLGLAPRPTAMTKKTSPNGGGSKLVFE